MISFFEQPRFHQRDAFFMITGDHEVPMLIDWQDAISLEIRNEIGLNI